MNELYDKLVLILKIFGVKTGIYNKLELGKLLVIHAGWTDDLYVYSDETLVCHFINGLNKKFIDGEWQEKLHLKYIEAKAKCQTQQKKEF